MLKIQITGIEDTQRFLEKYSDKKTLNETLKRAASLAKKLARDVYAPELSGFLKSMIYKRKTGELSWIVGCDAPYAVFHEYGSYNIPEGTPENPKKVKTGYSPFIRPGAWRAMKQLQSIYNDLVK